MIERAAGSRLRRKSALVFTRDGAALERLNSWRISCAFSKEIIEILRYVGSHTESLFYLYSEEENLYFWKAEKKEAEMKILPTLLSSILAG